MRRLLLLLGINFGHSFRLFHRIVFHRISKYDLYDPHFTRLTVLASRSPFVDALVEVAERHHHDRRFYFPSHCGGIILPESFKRLTSQSNSNNSLLSFDMPELDELDNIHSPVVSIIFSMEMNIFCLFSYFFSPRVLWSILWIKRQMCLERRDHGTW